MRIHYDPKGTIWVKGFWFKHLRCWAFVTRKWYVNCNYFI